jgi:hypothetical protein
MRGPYRVKARPRQWTDDGYQLGAENTEGEQRTRNGRSQAQLARPASGRGAELATWSTLEAPRDGDFGHAAAPGRTPC